MDMEKTNDIVVTILTLAYNHEPYIRQCLDGIVMQQTNFKFELLIHDDASTDGSRKIMEEYEKAEADRIDVVGGDYKEPDTTTRDLVVGIVFAGLAVGLVAVCINARKET